MSEGRRFGFHPLVFALAPILYLYSTNVHEVGIEEVVGPILIALCATTILWLALALLLWNPDKASIIASACVVLFFAYGHVFYGTDSFAVAGLRLGGLYIGRHRYLLLTFATVAMALSYVVFKTRRSTRALTGFLNVSSVALLMTSVLSLGADLMELREKPQQSLFIDVQADDISHTDTYPDIYYVILDAYARADILQGLFEYDNTPFIDYLDERGFFVASESLANYPKTLTSVPSSLNMAYLDDAVKNIFRQSFRRELTENGNVIRTLRDLGYTIVASPGVPLFTMETADVWLTPGGRDGLPSRFHEMLWHTTILGPLRGFDMFEYSFSSPEYVLYQLEQLEGVPDRLRSQDKPAFVFAHLMLTHTPYHFERNGKLRATSDGNDPNAQDRWRLSERHAYVDQIVYANSRLRRIIETIQTESSRPTVIVLQADHGPRFCIRTKQEPLILENFAIFNALCLPNGANQHLYDQMSPVNTFRAVFRHCFGADLEMLPDRSLTPTRGSHDPSGYVDVTDLLRATRADNLRFPE